MGDSPDCAREDGVLTMPRRSNVRSKKPTGGPGRDHKKSGARRWRQMALVLSVFFSGVAVMGLEITASQLMAPYFGRTVSVWTSLIGLVLVFLSAGYYLGGLLADRGPSMKALGAILIFASFSMFAVALASVPVLGAVQKLSPRLGILGACLVGTLVLLSAPITLLGCVCPYAIKLCTRDLRETGRAAGRIYAVSALGSVLGTFLPALFTIGAFGVRRSIMLFGFLLIAPALALLGRRRFVPLLGAGALLGLPLPSLFPREGRLAELESPYGYLQVLEMGGTRLLTVDTGVSSVYSPGRFRTGLYYDYLLLAPLMRPLPPREWLNRVLIIGLGAGTVAKQASSAYGPVEIDGVEVDPAVVDLGRRYFDMNEPNLRVYATDGRTFLATSRKRYDWVIVDAFQGCDIPSHLVTKEFFQLVRDRLVPQGVLSVNVAWWEPSDDELLRRVATTIRASFPTVIAVTGIRASHGAVILAGGSSTSPDAIASNALKTRHAGLIGVVSGLGHKGNPSMEALRDLGQPLTDDQAAVDRLVDRMYLRARKRAFGSLPL